MGDIGKVIHSDSSRLRHAKQVQDLCERLLIQTDIALHKPTFSAAETQGILPEGCLVQKTVTCRVENRLVLWTGVGDFRITRRQYKAANRQLGLPTRSGHTLNPYDVDPLAFYGMRPGMVSPFIAEDSRAAHELAAVFILDWTTVYDVDSSVAISLSLTESLIIKLEHLDMLLHAYVDTVCNHMPLYKISLE